MRDERIIFIYVLVLFAGIKAAFKTIYDCVMFQTAFCDLTGLVSIAASPAMVP